ncbi:triose-phosphate isomerase [candidate division KSB1 bacterium]
MMRRTIIAGNWKMNTEAAEAKTLAKSVVKLVGDKTDPVALLCPPFPLLSVVYEVVRNTPVKLGAQNVHPEPNGAFTGEVTDTMLASVGCEYVIIGHSERRTLFGEKDAFLNDKVKRVMTGPLTPILCIGETFKEREAVQTLARIEQQVHDGLKDVKLANGHDLVIAYEPVWAIGTGLTATPEQAEEVHEYIRNLLRNMYSTEIANDITIQYGGSMKPGNAKELLSKPNIDGGLIGGASLIADSFFGIIDAI